MKWRTLLNLPERTDTMTAQLHAAPAEHDTAQHPHHARRWLILCVLGLAQLMVVLDATIVNIALPSAQQALAFSNEDRQWIVTAYALAFGALLPLGGRVGDLIGRKNTLLNQDVVIARKRQCPTSSDE